MTVCLASTNTIKLEETAQIIPGVVGVRLDLLEVQSLDPSDVVLAKAHQVRELDLGYPVLVEDTGLAVDGWNGLPGALIKSFVDSLGVHELYRRLSASGEPSAATATSCLAVVHQEQIQMWRGDSTGRIVAPRGDLGGWTPIFEVDGAGLTLGEMSLDERMTFTMRREPLRAARDWLVARLALDGSYG